MPLRNPVSVSSTRSNTLIDYSSSDGFTFTASQISFENAVASLKNQFASDVMSAAKYSSTINLSYSRDGGVLTGVSTGTVSIASNKLVMDGDTNYKEVQYSPYKNFPPKDTGCMRMRYTPSYSGAPSTRQWLMTAVAANSQSVLLWHETSGALWLQILDRAGAVVAQTSGTYTAVSGTTVEIELNWSLATSGGIVTLYVDAARVISITDQTEQLSTAYVFFQIGGYVDDDTSHHANFKIHDLVFHDALQNSGATRATGYTVPSTKYLTNDPKIEDSMGVSTASLVGFQTTCYETGSDGIRFHIKVDDVAKYWNGSAWANSNGTYAQSNSDEDINTNAATLLSTTSVLKVVAVLHSHDGSTSPYIGSVSLLTE